MTFDGLADKYVDELAGSAPKRDRAGGGYGDLSPDELDRKVRERMAETGEDYVTALEHVADPR